MRYEAFFEEHSPDLYNDIKEHSLGFIQSGLVLYRGTAKPVTKTMILPVRKDRKPSDTPEYLHYILDGYFYQRFGIKARSQTVFCTQSLMMAKRYGGAVSVIPKGKATFIYSRKIQDLYGALDNNLLKRVDWNELKDVIGDRVDDLMKRYKLSVFNLIDLGKLLKKQHGGNIPTNVLTELSGLVFDMMDYFDYQVTDDPNSIGDMKNEIMVYCDEYYAMERNSNEAYKLEIEYNYLT